MISNLSEKTTMYDTAASTPKLPGGVTRAAGYVNGHYVSHPGLVKAYPKARVFGIDVLGTAWEEAAILDFEKGDVQDETTLRRFVSNRNAFREYTAVVYCDRSNIPTVEDYLSGLWHMLWVANWGFNGTKGESLTGTKVQGSGTLIVATQLQSLENYDLSDSLTEWN